MSVKTKQEFLRLLEALLEKDDETLTGDETLEELNWDSLAVVSFMAMADEKFGVILSAERINKAKSVAELMAFFGDQISA